MKKIILFDMDGTLTEPRKCIDKPMHKMLRYLSVQCKAEMGIVTGSGYDYVQNQLWPLLNDVVLRPSLHLLPCNGTEFWPAPLKPHLRHEMKVKMNMKDHIGEFAFKELMKIICRLQSQMIDEFEFPLTGHFVSNRESTINWCPIGRNADNVEREWFKGLDSDYGIRKKYYTLFHEQIEENRTFLYDASGKSMVDIVIGGSTSFDIYPVGWDKTFCLQYFVNGGYDTPWFIGDKCGPDGNDKPLYDVLKEEGRAFETTGPDNCIDLLTSKVIPNL